MRRRCSFYPALLLTAAVLRSLDPIEREIEARSGAWYIRRILPYRTQNSSVEGVVITFADITDRRRTADELGEAKRQADVANAVKSRFLAAASHDRRQPLQTLALVQGLLAKTVEGEKAQNLVARLDETLGAMSGMLNTRSISTRSRPAPYTPRWSNSRSMICSNGYGMSSPITLRPSDLSCGLCRAAS